MTKMLLLLLIMMMMMRTIMMVMLAVAMVYNGALMFGIWYLDNEYFGAYAMATCVNDGVLKLCGAAPILFGPTTKCENSICT